MSLLEVRNLTKVFGGLTAVNDVSFNVEKGEMVSLIGPNGAGKTTIFSMIAGLIKPTQGEIIFDNRNITKLKAYKIATAGLITTFQKTKVFPTLTIEEAVMIGTHRQNKTNILDILLRNKKFNLERKKSQNNVSDILEYTGLIEKKNHMCSELSYGEQRILEIAIAMAAKPIFLLLDEPAVGLNKTESNDLINMLSEIRNSGVTILLVEHDMDLVMKISNHIVVLNFGQKICYGTPKEVSCDKNVIGAYLGTTKED